MGSAFVVDPLVTASADGAFMALTAVIADRRCRLVIVVAAALEGASFSRPPEVPVLPASLSTGSSDPLDGLVLLLLDDRASLTILRCKTSLGSSDPAL